MKPDPICRCPICDRASPVTPREMEGLAEMEMRVVCSDCKKPSPAKDWMPQDE